MTSPWPTDGPLPRDELDVLSTAVLADVAEKIPGVSEDPPPGWTELVDGRGVYLRRTPGRPDTASRPPDAWYIHGLAGSSANWTSLAGVLSTRGTGYLVDLPGHGRSDPPPGGRYSLLRDADLLAVLIRRRSSGPVHLVANSMGGVIATALAARNPDLVASLTLISPAVPDLRLTRDRGADPVLALLLLPGDDPSGAATARRNRVGGPGPRDGSALLRGPHAAQRRGLRGPGRGAGMAGAGELGSPVDGRCAASPVEVVLPQFGFLLEGRRCGAGADPDRLGNA